MIKQISTMVEARHALRLLQDFLLDTAYPQAEAAANDVEHLGKLVFNIMNNGYVWVAYEDNEPIGLLMAVKDKNMWAPMNIEFRELVWYVKPQHRNTLVGGRLFKHYCQKGDELLSQGLIQGYFTTRMATTTAIDLERRGFRLTENTYLKERI
jgi:hypothetical protein